MKKFRNTKEMLDLMNQTNKEYSRLDLKTLGFEADRRTLRQLERQKLISKKENFAKNTTKKDKEGRPQLGTRFYTYCAVKK